MPCSSHPPGLGHSNYSYIWRRVKIIKLLVMPFSAMSRHFISPWFKYSQHPVFKHPQSVLLPKCQRPNSCVFRQQMRRHKVVDWLVASITRIQSRNFLMNQILICYGRSQLCHIFEASVIYTSIYVMMAELVTDVLYWRLSGDCSVAYIRHCCM
jgi:hypothetical protein